MSEQKKPNDVVRVGESANKLPGADPQALGHSPAEQDANKEVNKVFPNNPVQGLGVHPARNAVEKGDDISPEAKQRLADLKRTEQLTGASQVAAPFGVKAEEAELMKKTQDILKEYGGLEGNIPVHHDYWVMMNQLRVMRAPKF